MDSLAPASDKVSILLVDDNAENLLALSAILANLNYEIVTARSGQEALRRTLRQDFALILLDVRMPEMNGFEVATALKSRARTRLIPIIFLTAEASDVDNIYLGYSVGAVDYLQKPLEPRIVCAKVAIFAELYRKNQQVVSQTQRLLESERRARQLELEAIRQQSQRKYRELANAIPHLVWTATTSGEFNYANQRTSEFFGFQPDSHLGWDIIATRMHPYDYARFADEWKHSLEKITAITLECRLKPLEDSPFRWHLCRVLPEFNEKNEHVGWIGTFTDIHEQKAANLAKDEFLATLSHELRTPLNVILGWVELLRNERPSDEEFDDTMKMIERNARVLITLINDLLDVSRVITGKLHLNLRPIALQNIVEAAVTSLRVNAQEKHISVTTNVGCGKCVVNGDSDRLQQVVWNLLSNAIKFTPDGGTVHIDLNQENDKVSLSVTDNGKGIAPEFVSLVFDKFLQEDSSTTRAQGGLGLGLAIVRQLVELHGGTVSVKSEGKGKGATFTVTFRAVEATAESIKESTGVALQAATSSRSDKKTKLRVSNLKSLSGIKVLIVDDAPDVRFLLGRMLTREGANVTTAASVDEALAILKNEYPQVLVSDIGMPERDGFDLIRTLRQIEKSDGKETSTPAIALTAYVREEEKERVLNAGFQKHVAKPVEASVLTSAVREVLNAP